MGKSKSRYMVGIDLGTTHTVVAYAEIAQRIEVPEIALFEIEQLVAPGEVAARPMLPSLRYHLLAGEMEAVDLQLPWRAPSAQTPTVVVGELARELGSKVPGRLVASAKSWLSHATVDRTAPILPWGAEAEIQKISPLDASASYLAYVVAAWNNSFPEDPLTCQEVVLTVPASFDEAARALTVEAAHIAGLSQVRLLEEPQAACYDWLLQHRDDLAETLAESRLLLVCDVGGGTTDLTLIQVEPDASVPRLKRIGVGDHLMLGGDNMDLALAHTAERRLVSSGNRLSAADLSQLTQQCRSAKERLLAADAPERTTVTMLGAGARLIGGARSTELERNEVQRLVIEGFFPQVSRDETPRRKRAGIVEFGLPYAADPAITRHLAAFLMRHERESRKALGQAADQTESDNIPPMPDTILLNGGVFRSSALSERLNEVFTSWRGSPPLQLHNPQPEHAVARGAVAYALARHGRGHKIGGGSARGYYLPLEEKQDQQKHAVCLLPRGQEAGQELLLKTRSFTVRVGEPARFHLLSSSSDRPHQPGELVAINPEQFAQLPPIAALLKDQERSIQQGSEVPVQLTAMLTEVGTLAIGCIAENDPNRRWKLEFQLRGAATGQISGIGSELHPRLADATEYIRVVYGSKSKKIDPRAIKRLRADLEKTLGPREQWETPLLRELFAVLWDNVKRRRRSADHERIWFSLTGYCLRPGFGYSLDDWRLEQLCSILQESVQYAQDERVWSEWWILWRRIAGGLEQQMQERLFENIAPHLQPPGRKSKKPSGPKKQGYNDMVRLAASLERLTIEHKIETGSWLLERLRKKGEPAQTWWAVGRLGARLPLYGSAHKVIPQAVATAWMEQLLSIDWHREQQAAFAATMLARLSGDRSRDLDTEIRTTVVKRLRAAKAPMSWLRMVEQVTDLNEQDEQRVFGESLPPGLRLIL